MCSPWRLGSTRTLILLARHSPEAELGKQRNRATGTLAATLQCCKPCARNDGGYRKTRLIRGFGSVLAASELSCTVTDAELSVRSAPCCHFADLLWMAAMASDSNLSVRKHGLQSLRPAAPQPTFDSHAFRYLSER